MTATLDGLLLPEAIIDMEDFEESHNILIFGDSGIGKTVFSGDVALLITTEKGAISAKRAGKKCKIWKAYTWEDVQDAYKWARDNLTREHWIGLDSGTEMQILCLESILQETGAKKDGKDPDVPEIQDHNVWQHRFKKFIKKFCDLNCNVLITATPMVAEDEEGNQKILPEFSGKGYQISSGVCARMGMVLNVTKIRKKIGEDENGKPKIVEARRYFGQLRKLESGSTVFAKDRYNVLGKYKDDLTLPELIRLINEGETRPVPARVSRPKVKTKAKTTTAAIEPEPKNDSEPDPDGYLIDRQGPEMKNTQGEEDLSLDED